MGHNTIVTGIWYAGVYLFNADSNILKELALALRGAEMELLKYKDAVQVVQSRINLLKSSKRKSKTDKYRLEGMEVCLANLAKLAETRAKAGAPSEEDLQKQLDDPGAEVTPELFIAGLKQAFSHEYLVRPSFEEILLEMWGMQRKKGADYGSNNDPLANLVGAEEYGVPAWLSCILRLDDKRRRIASFAKKMKLENESAADAFIDLAVYAVHAVRLYREWCRNRNAASKQKIEFVFDCGKEVWVLNK